MREYIYKKGKIRKEHFSYAFARKYKIKRIDLLQIDTERYDYDIIKQIDFSLIKPRMICYETHNLTGKMK